MAAPQIVPVGLLHPTGSSLDLTIHTEQKGKLYSNDALFEHLYHPISRLKFIYRQNLP